MKALTMLLCCCLPLKHLQLSSPFGYRVHPVTNRYKFHYGIDLHARHDTVFAITGGKATIGYNEFLGITISVTDEKLRCTYGHLSYLLIGNEEISAGTPLAITGATGRVTGEHLHLSISYNGQPVDPLKFLYQITIKSNNHE